MSGTDERPIDITKSVEEARDQSIQERAKPDAPDYGAIGLLWWLARSGELVSPWWSKVRDSELRQYWKQSDHLSGAFYNIGTKLTSVPVHVEPRDMSLKSHIRDAERYTRILVEESEFGDGWQNTFGRWLDDLWTQDNGAFWEIIGPGPADGPLLGPSAGIAHLDSYRCQRTQNTEFPVIYTDQDGTRYKLHRTRVATYSQMPSPAVEMRGVGFCWESRAINTAQNLIDIGRYKQEKLGSRPLRAMMFGKGIQSGTIASALAITASAMDAQGLARFAKIPIIEAQSKEAEIDLIDLASLPDGFDEETSTTLGMYAIALTGAVPPRWLWPATTTGATKADAMFQHIAGIGGGAGQTLAVVTQMLGGSPRGAHHSGGKFLPPHLKLVFDFQDDEQDRMRAEITRTRSETRESNLLTGVTDVRTERQNMLKAGEITEDQFRDLELKDGRLPDGTSVLALFAAPQDSGRHLALGVPDPLNVESNDAATMLTIIREMKAAAQLAIHSASRNSERVNAQQAVAALSALETLYLESGKPGEPIPMGDDTEMPEEAEERESEGEKARPFPSQ